MSQYSLSHLSDGTLLHDLTALVARDRATTAALLAHLAEVDARKLYLPAAYPSMYLYCVRELRMSEDVAFARIRVARTARLFPAIFAALADGRLHLTAVVQLTPHLTPDTADELLAAAAHKTKTEIELLLAERFPRPDVQTLVQGIAAPVATLSVRTVEAPGVQLVPEPVGGLVLQQVPESVAPPTLQLAPERADRAKLTPLAPERFALQVTIGQSTRDKLRYAQELLGHQVPAGDVAAVLDRALDALIQRLEQRKFAAASRPARGCRPVTAGRYVPADVKRAVWERDQGQCTFRSETGQRCPARTRLEFDHVNEVARGGRATIGGIRLRCRAHNQYGAERTFGAEFMRHKRESAQRAAQARTHFARAQSRARIVGPEACAQVAPTVIRSRVDLREQADISEQADIMAGLRNLGFRADEARRAAEYSATLHDATLERRMRAALKTLGRRAALGAGRGLSPRDETRTPAY